MVWSNWKVNGPHFEVLGYVISYKGIKGWTICFNIGEKKENFYKGSTSIKSMDMLEMHVKEVDEIS